MFSFVKYYLGTLFFVAMSWSAMSLSLNSSESTTNDDLSLLVAKMEAEIIDLKNDLSGVKQDVADVRGCCSTSTDTATDTATSTNGTSDVAFMAALTSDTSGCDSNKPIPFENVLVNAGNGYHKRQGIFRAPRSGIYYFGLALSVRSNNYFSVRMVKNSGNYEIGNLYQRTEAHGQITSSSALVQLSAGDEVWCKCTQTSSFLAGGDTYHSHFSGYLVTEA